LGGRLEPSTSKLVEAIGFSYSSFFFWNSFWFSFPILFLDFFKKNRYFTFFFKKKLIFCCFTQSFGRSLEFLFFKKIFLF